MCTDILTTDDGHADFILSWQQSAGIGWRDWRFCDISLWVVLFRWHRALWCSYEVVVYDSEILARAIEEVHWSMLWSPFWYFIGKFCSIAILTCPSQFLRISYASFPQNFPSYSIRTVRSRQKYHQCRTTLVQPLLPNDFGSSQKVKYVYLYCNNYICALLWHWP